MGILTEEMKRVVREQRLGFVATVCPDGTPNLSPKGTTAVWDDDHLVFAEIRSPGTLANLRTNPAMEINVVDPVVRKGYRFKGTARVFTAGALFDQIINFYQSGDRRRGTVHDLGKRIRSVVVMTVERALPLVSPAYDTGLSEDEVREAWERYWDTIRQTTESRTR
ncbi:MAG TPA: pyridoxamine 5'-phosphate oxidase family protein [bacterium]|nr:pyridoxamine 5'-phosphate oxidase family protein [bacterium]